MFLGDPVDVVTEVERQVGHVQIVFPAQHVLRRRHVGAAQHAIDQVGRELIVARRHRRVRGEHALSADLFDVLAREARVAGSHGLFVEQRQGQQTGMAFIHMKPLECVVTERAEHIHATYAEDYFLTESVVGVAPVQPMRQGTVPVRILGQLGVQQIT
jgi:hypothetical protein